MRAGERTHFPFLQGHWLAGDISCPPEGQEDVSAAPESVERLLRKDAEMMRQNQKNIEPAFCDATNLPVASSNMVYYNH